MGRRPVVYNPPPNNNNNNRRDNFDSTAFMQAVFDITLSLLVLRPDIQVRGTCEHDELHGPRVAQSLLLFKCEWVGKHQEHELAYISRGLRRSAPPIQKVDYFVGRTKKRTTVIEVKDIERGVHLMPPSLLLKLGRQLIAKEIGVRKGAMAIANQHSRDGQGTVRSYERKKVVFFGAVHGVLVEWLDQESQLRDYLRKTEGLFVVGGRDGGRWSRWNRWSMWRQFGGGGGDLPEADGGRWRPRFSVVDGGSGGE